MELKVKKFRDNAIIPTKGSEQAAGVDLYACLKESIGIQPNQTLLIPSGIGCDFPEGYFGMIVPRSSVGIKRNLILPNSAGIIDFDYKGEILLAFHNIGDTTEIISPGERLAQMILLPYVTYNIVETDELTDTERGEGGIGSTGV